MRKRIRIRKSVTVAAFAMVLSFALVGPAAAYEVSESGGSKSKACDVDPRILNNEPQICSEDGYQGVTSTTEIEPSSTQAPASGTPWAAYTLLGLAVAVAATLSAFRRHPQAVS